MRFGLFHFNPDTGELLREGHAVRLAAQPAQLLALLIKARGDLVTREALQEALWPPGTNVDFDRSLNFAVAQLRTALGDSAESPTFIRTIPKRGYQFIAPLVEPPAPAATPSRRKIYVGAAATLTLGLAAVWLFRPTEPRIAIARFENETGRPELDRLAGTLTDSLVETFTTQTAGRYGVIGNAAILRRSRQFQDLDEIAATLQAQYVIIGQVQPDGARTRVLAHLIRMPGKTHVKVSRLILPPAPDESQLAGQIAADLLPRLSSPAFATR